MSLYSVFIMALLQVIIRLLSYVQAKVVFIKLSGTNHKLAKIALNDGKLYNRV